MPAEVTPAAYGTAGVVNNAIRVRGQEDSLVIVDKRDRIQGASLDKAVAENAAQIERRALRACKMECVMKRDVEEGQCATELVQFILENAGAGRAVKDTAPCTFEQRTRGSSIRPQQIDQVQHFHGNASTASRFSRLNWRLRCFASELTNSQVKVYVRGIMVSDEQGTRISAHVIIMLDRIQPEAASKGRLLDVDQTTAPMHEAFRTFKTHGPHRRKSSRTSGCL